MITNIFLGLAALVVLVLVIITWLGRDPNRDSRALARRQDAELSGAVYIVLPAHSTVEHHHTHDHRHTHVHVRPWYDWDDGGGGGWGWGEPAPQLSPPPQNKRLTSRNGVICVDRSAGQLQAPVRGYLEDKRLD